MSDHEVFDQEKFWDAFKQDFASARARILIECPFLSYWRLTELGRLIQNATNRGVVVCVFLQRESKRSANNTSEELIDKRKEKERLIDLLQSWKVHINQRTYVHSKVAIIDDRIFWDGSLNILSHFSNAHERMNRWVDRKKVRSAIVEQALDCTECERILVRFLPQNEPSPDFGWGKLLKVQREWQEQTQQEIADISGLDRTVLSKIENGKRSSIRNVMSISKAINSKFVMLPDYLVNYVGSALDRATSADNGEPDDRR